MERLPDMPREKSLWPLRIVPAALLAAGLASCGGSADRGAGAQDAKDLEVPCSQHSEPLLHTMGDQGIALTSGLALPPGRYALPVDPAPTQLVVAFHGHGNDSCAWRHHLREIAARGAIAVAMDYTGQRQEPVENYGWFVREGAADSIAAARHFLEKYPSITTVHAFGISMGGNASGVAIASPDAVRADGSPLFDWWVDVEGVNNLIEEYLIIRAVAPVNAGAQLAQDEIHEENGGSLEEVPEAYAELTNVLRAPDMTGLRGAVIVHAVDDGLVSPSQSPEMAVALTLVGVPTRLVEVIGHGEGETGTTATAIVADPIFTAAGQDYTSPFAGHGWEASTTHLVITAGFEELFALMGGATVEPGLTIIPGVQAP